MIKHILYVETFATEWDYYCSEFFYDINELVDDISNAYYDDEIEDLNTTPKDLDSDGLDRFFREAIIAVINQLQASKCFDSKLFEHDLLLGLQFADPDMDLKELVLKISEQINSSKWHKKMLASYRQ